MADASDVAVAVISEVFRGTRTKIRRNTERAILAVDQGAVADGGLVPAKKTRALLRWMLKRGWSKTELAAELGSEAKNPALQVATPQRDFVRARTALKVEKLHRYFVEALEATDALESAATYGIEERLAILRRDPECTNAEILSEYGHVWANERALTRDRAVLRDVQRAEERGAA